MHVALGGNKRNYFVFSVAKADHFSFNIWYTSIFSKTCYYYDRSRDLHELVKKKMRCFDNIEKELMKPQNLQSLKQPSVKQLKMSLEYWPVGYVAMIILFLQQNYVNCKSLQQL